MRRRTPPPHEVVMQAESLCACDRPDGSATCQIPQVGDDGRVACGAMRRALAAIARAGGHVVAATPAEPQPQRGGARHHMDDAERAEVVRRHQAGERASAIARSLGRSPSSVTSVLRRAGVPSRLSPEQQVAARDRMKIIRERAAAVKRPEPGEPPHPPGRPPEARPPGNVRRM